MRIFTFFLIIGLLSLSACGGIEREAKYPTGADRSSTGDNIYKKPDSIFGEGGLKLFSSQRADDENASGIGVNSFLWRASLDTLSFMPFHSADPFGGVILTDWYSAAETPNERLKVNVFILDRQLRADGIRVSVFRQVRDNENAEWKDAPVSEGTGRQLEDTILTRARELRVAQMQSTPSN